jgi:hypothetical protein
MSFRTQLAELIGHDLYNIWRNPQVTNDPILPLLNHSDCDGHLTPEECKAVAPRLRELIPQLDDWDRSQAAKLCEGMEAAATAGENLEFC